jgi:mycobactin lysine-N-oxygenase
MNTMQNMDDITTPPKLIGIGCGPRNIAIACLAKVIADQTGKQIDLKIIEARDVGANWDGRVGYTDGRFPLDTSPLKDLTFPGTTGYGPAVDREISRFSFIEFQKEVGQFERWVSLGLPPISHTTFAAYQRWAVQKSGVQIIFGEVKNIKVVDTRLEVTAAPASGYSMDEFKMMADGVVLSGPGEPKRVPVQDDDPDRIFDGRSYWTNRHRFQNLPTGRVAIIGSGLSAGTAANSILVENPHVQVDMINRYGFLPLQSAGYHENSMCSAPTAEWESIPLTERQEILSRINNGVLEASIKRFLDCQVNLRVLRGHVKEVRSDERGVSVYSADGLIGEYDRVVVAVGFDPVGTVCKLLSGQQTSDTPMRSGASNYLTDYHLRLPAQAANIHVPALAGLSQGPGLSLLSCLGTMASRVISTYIPHETGPYRQPRVRSTCI